MTEQERRKKHTRQNLLMMIILYFALAYVTIHIGAVFNNYEKFDITMLEKIGTDISIHMETVPFFIPQKSDLKFLMYFSMIYFPLAWYFVSTQKKYMFGKEHGTAEWADKNDVKKIMDKDKDKNIIFTQTEQMSLDTRKTRKNLNVLVIGGAGTGKSRFVVKPNLLQGNTSYVVTDPKGELARDTGNFFKENGYKVKVFNLIDMDYSSRYNPFVYIKTENDVMKLINCLIKNTNPKTGGGTDPFWEKSETALLQALFYLMWYEIVPEEQNFKTLMSLIRLAEVKEEDEEYESDLDLVFKQLEENKPDHIALKQYAIFKQGAGKTAKSILISIGVRFSVFNMESVSDLTAKDELNLGELGNEKTILFLVIPDSHTTFNFLAAMMYSQLFDSLYYTADFENKGRLKYHVRCILDEFANIGEIPDFDKLIATMRSREISCTIILQNLAQLKTMYKDNWESITGNCDSLLFLGSKEQSTLEYVSKSLGKETIDTRNINISKGKQGSASYNYGIQGRELMLSDEIGRMADKNCILMIRGMHPFFSDKFKLEQHKNYKYLYDASDDNFFDVSKVRKYENEKEKEEERIKTIENYSIESFTLDQEQISSLYSNLDNQIKDEEDNFETINLFEDYDEELEEPETMEFDDETIF